MNEDTISIFTSMNDRFKSAEAATSFRGWCPPAGEHEAMLLSIEADHADFVYKNPSGQKVSVPGGKIQFEYRLLSDPDSAEAPRSWKGVDNIMPLQASDYSNLPDNQRQRVDITDGRVKASLLTLLGMPTDTKMDLTDALTRAKGLLQQKMNEGQALCVKVDQPWRQYKGKDYPGDEIIREVLN